MNRVSIHRVVSFFPLLFFMIVHLSSFSAAGNDTNTAVQLFFDEGMSFHYLIGQMELGPRIPGSVGSKEVRNLINESLGSEWAVKFQNFTPEGTWNPQNVELANIIAERSSDSSSEWIILGAHYDTRRMADSDPDPANRNLTVPGANDGASGVAVLLELANAIVKHDLMGIRLLFFDGEDQGRLGDWPWIVGSSYYVSQLTDRNSIRAAVIFDMIGDSNLQIYKEKNSVRENPKLVDSIWEVAADLGYEDIFIPSEKYTVLDDHTPFLTREIPAIDLIDLDYPHWHTTADTIDKTSPLSLGIVGETIELWLLRKRSFFPSEDTENAAISTFWTFAGIATASIAMQFRKHKDHSKYSSFAGIFSQDDGI